MLVSRPRTDGMGRTHEHQVQTAAARLSECCVEILPGFSVAGRLEHVLKGTHQVLLTRHLRDGVPYHFQPQDELRILPRRETHNYEVVRGDVVFMSRGTRNRAWVIGDVPAPTIVPVSFYILRPWDGIEPRYLAWYLNQAPAQAAIDQSRTGRRTGRSRETHATFLSHVGWNYFFQPPLR